MKTLRICCVCASKGCHLSDVKQVYRLVLLIRREAGCRSLQIGMFALTLRKTLIEEADKPGSRPNTGRLPWRAVASLTYLRRDATALGFLLLSIGDITSSFLKDGG
jgi:hypothetical protein